MWFVKNNPSLDFVKLCCGIVMELARLGNMRHKNFTTIHIKKLPEKHQAA